MASENSVTISLDRYNSLKQENIRCRMLLDNILTSASLKEDESGLEFDQETVNTAIKFCYLDTWKKKVAYLKTAKRKYGEEKKG